MIQSIKSLVFNGQKYVRANSSTRTELEVQLAATYGPDVQACIFPSGMAAIACCFFLQSERGGGTVFLANELYCDTPRVLGRFRNIRTVFFDPADEETFETLFKKHRPVMVFMEGYSNPSGIKYNPKIIEVVRRAKTNCKVVVDNTFASPVLFNPFEHPAAPYLVIDSLTKYVSGGQRIAGAVFGRSANALSPFRRWTREFGQHIPDDHLRVILDANKTMTTRVTKASELAQKVYDFIASEFTMHTPKMSPMIPVLSFSMPTERSKRSILEIDTGIPWETSYGSPHSKICNYIRVRDGIAYFRLSLGYEDTPERVRAALLKLKDELKKNDF